MKVLTKSSRSCSRGGVISSVVRPKTLQNNRTLPQLRAASSSAPTSSDLTTRAASAVPDLDLALRLAKAAKDAYTSPTSWSYISQSGMPEKWDAVWEAPVQDQYSYPAGSGKLLAAYYCNDHDNLIKFLEDANNKEIVVSYRGSDNTSNWLTNMQIKMVPLEGFEGVKVHEGFKVAVEDNFTDLTKILAKLVESRPTWSVRVTGHSLGAAMATLFAFKLATSADRAKILGPRSSDLTVYTFASPRLGNQQFAEAFSSAALKGFRIANANDMVPRVPVLSPDREGYLHVVPELYLPDGKVIDNLHDWSLWASRRIQALGFWATHVVSLKGGKLMGDVLDNHSMETYIKMLEAVKLRTSLDEGARTHAAAPTTPNFQ